MLVSKDLREEAQNFILIMWWKRMVQWFTINRPKQTRTGTIKFFNRAKGYGFIRSAQTTKDVFVHASEVSSKLRQGDQVEFQLDFNQKGLIAKNVRRLEESSIPT